MKILFNIKGGNKTKLPNDIEWKEFKLNKILKILGSGKELISISKDGNINLISSQDGNNGVAKKIEKGKKLFFANKLTLSKNGSVGTTYYQNNDFYATSDIMVLENKYLNENIGLFLKVSIEKYTKKFNWGDKINLEKFNSLIISLPSKNNEPDWKYMDKFIEERKKAMKIDFTHPQRF